MSKGSLLTPLGQGQAYLKAGFLGFQAGGKTWTATLLAIAVRNFFELKGPIAMFDTEGGSEYVAPLIREQTGMDPVGIKSRSLDQLCELTEECVSAGVSVLIGDSMTHVWREVCEAYLQDINKRLKYWATQNNRRFVPKKNLEFQDWGPVKKLWNRWTDLYLNAPLHMIIAGRAGFEYDMEADDDGKKQLIKTGVKMKAEGEFGFEPSLLVEMDREQKNDGAGGFTIHRRATVLKDRFNIIDGATIELGEREPAKQLVQTFEFFRPHLELLKPGQHTPIDTRVQTQTGADEDGTDAWQRERRARTILCEEIQGEITAKYPGQTAAEKKEKADVLHTIFQTRSWTAVESMDSRKLREGLHFLREKFGTLPPKPGPEVLCACPDGPGGEHLAGCNGAAVVAAPVIAEEAAVEF